MVSDSTVEWARDRLKKGFDEEEVREILSKTKYADQADEIMEKASEKPAPEGKKEEKPKPKPEKKKPKKQKSLHDKILVVLVILFLISLGGMLFSALKENETRETGSSTVIQDMVDQLVVLKNTDQTEKHVQVEFYAGDVVDAKSLKSVAGTGDVQFCAANTQKLVFPTGCQATVSDVCPTGFFFDGAPSNQFFDQGEWNTFTQKVTATKKVTGDLRVSQECGVYFIGFKAFE
jgi:hypothetical protein